MAKLNNCPCCGAEARVMTERETFEGNVKDFGSACLVIECTNKSGCGLKTFCHYDSTDYDVMVAVATDRFNWRVPCE